MAECDTQTCVCFEDGVQTGTCASQGVCAMFGDLDSLPLIVEFVRDCCGF